MRIFTSIGADTEGRISQGLLNIVPSLLAHTISVSCLYLSRGASRTHLFGLEVLYIWFLITIQLLTLVTSVEKKQTQVDIIIMNQD